MTNLQWFYTFGAAYIFMLFAIAFFVKDKSASSIDFFLSQKRPFGIVALVFTFSATLMSAFFIVGMPGFAYTHGAILWPYVIFGDVLGLLGLFFVGRRILTLKRELELAGQTIVSPLQVISPSRSGRFAILLVTGIFILPYLAVQISGFGRVIESTSGGSIDFLSAAVGALAIIWIYSSISGIRGVVYSDLAQGIILLGAALIVSGVFIVGNFSGPIDVLKQVADISPGHLRSPGPKGLGSFPVLFSSMIMFAAIMISQPQFLTRYVLLGTEKSTEYLQGMVIGLGIALAILTIPILFLGLGGVVVYPNLGSGDSLMGQVLADNFSGWAAMAMSVAILAAAMSTADSILFSIGQMISVDVLQDHFGLSRTDTSSLFAARIVIFLIAIGALVFGVLNNQLIVQLSTLTFAGCLQVVPAIIGGLWHRSAWAYSGALSAIVGVLSLFLLRSVDSTNLLGFHAAIPSLAIGASVYLGSDFIVRWAHSR